MTIGAPCLMTRCSLTSAVTLFAAMALCSPSAWADEPAARALANAATATAIEAPAAASATEADDALPFKLSLPTESDRSAWRTAGFRMQLGINYGQLIGLVGAPSGTLRGAVIRIGARLDEAWSLLTSLQYAAATEVGGLSALRFAGTIDPTWHATDHVDVAVGLGFGGIVEAGNTGRPELDAALRASLVDSYTLTNARKPLAACTGIGTAGLMRIGWTAVLSELSSTSIALQVDGQWTACQDNLRLVEPDTAEPAYRRQWWPHVGGSLAWLLGWR